MSAAAAGVSRAEHRCTRDTSHVLYVTVSALRAYDDDDYAYAYTVAGDEPYATSRKSTTLI